MTTSGKESTAKARTRLLREELVRLYSEALPSSEAQPTEETVEGADAQESNCGEAAADDVSFERVDVTFITRCASLDGWEDDEVQLHVVGDKEELGAWNLDRAPVLKRLPGHRDVWYGSLQVSVGADRSFLYKYVAKRSLVLPYLGHNDVVTSVAWESGISGNRKCNVDTIRTDAGGRYACDSRVRFGFRRKGTLTFRIHYNLADTERMYITGDPVEIGSWIHPGPVPMQLTEPLPLPTGGLGRYWQLKVPRPPTSSFSYRYVIKDSTTQFARWEREPNRRFDATRRKLEAETTGSVAVVAPIADDAGSPTVHDVGKEAAVPSAAVDGERGAVTTRVSRLEADAEQKAGDDAGREGVKTMADHGGLENADDAVEEDGDLEDEEDADLEDGEDIPDDTEEDLVISDVNFISAMEFNEVPPTFFIGPYPQTEADIEAIKEAGAAAVLSVQTDDDIRHRGLNWQVMQDKYRELGVRIERWAIEDFNADSLRTNLLQATALLRTMVEDGGGEEASRVYVHCTAGMSRAAATVILYLVRFLGYDVDEAYRHVKKHRPVIAPNMHIVRLVAEPFAKAKPVTSTAEAGTTAAAQSEGSVSPPDAVNVEQVADTIL